MEYAKQIPPSPDNAPQIIMAARRICPTCLPAASTAWGLSPQARRCMPKRVLYITNHATKATTTITSSNGDSNIVLTSGLKVMHDTVYNVLNEVKDGSFKGANVTLTAADDATGFVSEEGRCQLTAEAIEKINAAQALLKEGKIVPAANFNGVTPETFTW